MFGPSPPATRLLACGYAPVSPPGMWEYGRPRVVGWNKQCRANASPSVHRGARNNRHPLRSETLRSTRGVCVGADREEARRQGAAAAALIRRAYKDPGDPQGCAARFESSSETVRLRINDRGRGRDGVLRAGSEMMCAGTDGDSRLTFGHDPTVGQDPPPWEGRRKTAEDSTIFAS